MGEQMVNHCYADAAIKTGILERNGKAVTLKDIKRSFETDFQKAFATVTSDHTNVGIDIQIFAISATYVQNTAAKLKWF